MIKSVNQSRVRTNRCGEMRRSSGHLDLVIHLEWIYDNRQDDVCKWILRDRF